ncbi:winged helix-turn-helix domain-containing protein [Saccharicrinis aurantiacus]|uniref:winged helix-turn-helix domain-containing protein n=1 Tax=Saccharicrinis aurantiacus TaxID=1849719 RepID=UPI002490D22B|nr:LysR family transcriptional regulator [Saccharicrinis aurantiacus]
MEVFIKAAYSIEVEGFVINSKVINILREVNKTGSLNSAVSNLGMSYSYAWNLIYKTGCQLECPLIVSRKGGNGGGVAKLTEGGIKLLNYCDQFESDLSNFTGVRSITL